MQPLKGVTVLDISRLLPGGYASLLLLELGARVIKVEQPGVGDYYRAVFKGKGILGSQQVEVINQGKESLGLDLKSKEGRTLFKKLVRETDVVIENFRPGVLKKLKLDYSSLKKVNQTIILCSLTGFGQRGSRQGLAGHDLNYLGLSGLLARIKDSKGELVLPDFQVIDLMAGTGAALQILSALHQRARTKKGCWLDCSMMEAGYSMARLYHSREAGEVSPVAGGLVRYGIYEGSDGKKITLGALEPKFWIRFCQVIGRPGWAEEAHRFEFLGEAKREELKGIFKGKTAREWIEIGAREDLCLFPVEEIRDLPLFPKRSAPSLGEHTVRILRSLGYTRSQIRGLKKKGIVQ